MEGAAKRQPDDLTGKTCSMKRVIMANRPVAQSLASLAGLHTVQNTGQQAPWSSSLDSCRGPQMHPNLASSFGREILLAAGDYAAVHVQSAGASTLYVEPIARTTLREFVSLYGSTLPAVRWSAASSLHANLRLQQSTQRVWPCTVNPIAGNEQNNTTPGMHF